MSYVVLDYRLLVSGFFWQNFWLGGLFTIFCGWRTWSGTTHG